MTWRNTNKFLVASHAGYGVGSSPTIDRWGPGGCCSMKTTSNRAQSPADSAAGIIQDGQRAPDPAVVKFINTMFRMTLGRSAGCEEIAELNGLISKGGRSLAVASVLHMEESLVRLATPWFWKLLSRSPSEKE